MCELNKKEIALLKKHDEAIYDKIREKYINKICFFLQSNFDLCLDEIKDIANDAFVKAAYYKIHLFNPKISKFSTWLFTIAKNECSNYLKKFGHILSHKNTNTNTNQQEDPYPQFLFELEILLSEVEFALLLDYFLYDLSYREIAKKHDVTLYFVKKTIKLALKKIDDCKEELL